MTTHLKNKINSPLLLSVKIILIPILLLGLIACTTNKKAISGMEYRAQEKAENNSEMTDPVNNGRLMVYTATQNIKVKNTEGVIKKIENIIKNTEGYILEKSQTYIRFRVPSDSLDIVLNKTSKLGEVATQNVHGQDVTEQHTDLNLRLDNAQKARERYLQLLNKAEKVSDILLIEKELERLQYEIENLQGRLNKLDETIAYSTVQVYVVEKIKPGPLGWVFVGLYEAVKFLFVWD